MAKTREERDEINRQNAQKSTGPTSDQGRKASRCNALKHGLAATTIDPVDAPGEPHGAYQERLDAWVADVQPRNVLEMAMVQRACRATWKLDRCARFEDAAAARRRSRGADPAPGETSRLSDALVLGNMLMFAVHRREHNHPEGHDGDGVPRNEPSLFDDAPRDTAALCRFKEGVEWMLNAWADVLPNLPAEGDPPLDGADVFHWRVRQRAFRLLGLPTGAPPPAQPLREAGEAEVRRLRSLLTGMSARDSARFETDLALFSAGPEAQLLMRYESQAERELHRAVNTLLKLRKDPDLVPPPEPAPAAAPEPAPAPEPAAAPVPASPPDPAPRVEPPPRAQNEATPAVPPACPVGVQTSPVVRLRPMIGGP